MADHTIRIRWATLSDFDGRFRDLEAGLPAPEQERARRFKVAAAGQRFLLARDLLRRTLGEHLDVAPRSLIFGIGEHGKPHIVDPKPPPAFGFNISHSGEMVVLATAAREIGVDVEHLRSDPNSQRLAHRFFSPAERELILALDGTARDHAFLRVWTQKEAWLKATGLGVGMRLAEVETEADPKRPARLLAISGDRNEAGRWSFAEVEIPRAVCVAAIRGAPPELEVRRITPDDIERS
jgi:4'-phosphopantetheinyl transferase